MRPLTIDHYPAIAAGTDAGPAPMLQWVAIELFVVDDACQRPIAQDGRRNVERIARGFQWSKFAPVVAAPVEGGRFAIIDGQHRTTAAWLAGHTQVPCMIIPIGARAQAEAFSAINGNITRLSPVQLHRAAVAAGDEQALRIERVCAAAGVKIRPSSQISVANMKRLPTGAAAGTADMTASVKAIASQLSLADEATVVLGLKAIVAGTPCNSLLGPSVMRAVISLLHMHDEWCASPARLLAAFETIDLEELLTKSRVESIGRPGVDTSTLLQARLADRLTRKLRQAA